VNLLILVVDDEPDVEALFRSSSGVNSARRFAMEFAAIGRWPFSASPMLVPSLSF